MKLEVEKWKRCQSKVRKASWKNGKGIIQSGENGKKLKKMREMSKDMVLETWKIHNGK